MAGLRAPWPAMVELAREGRGGEGEGERTGGAAVRKRKGGRGTWGGCKSGARPQHGCSVQGFVHDCSA
jgi:hypothetical protein